MIDEVPPVAYARTADGSHLAYQAFGEGDVDLVLLWGGMSHVEVMWENPSLNRLFRRLASFCRVVQFDRRGVGLSDRGARASLDERLDDLSAVLDAVEFRNPVLFGESEGAPLACVFAATYPERARAVVLYGPLVRMIGDATFPFAPPRDSFEAALDETIATWGDEDAIWPWAPSVGGEPSARKFFARFARQSCSPGSYREQMSVSSQIDVRPVLALVHAPSLVIHRTDDVVVRVQQGRYAAAQIPNAKLVEIPGEDHLLIGGDVDAVVDEIEKFVTGSVAPTDVDRVFSTILFVDIVGSTPEAIRLGDHEWRRLLDRFDALVEREAGRAGGRRVKQTGDGALVGFPTPAHAITAAAAITAGVRALGVQARAGLHSGECERRGEDLSGVAVHIASRVCSLAAADEVLLSSAVNDLIAGSDIECEPRGVHILKGVPGEWPLFAVAN